MFSLVHHHKLWRYGRGLQLAKKRLFINQISTKQQLKPIEKKVDVQPREQHPEPLTIVIPNKTTKPFFFLSSPAPQIGVDLNEADKTILQTSRKREVKTTEQLWTITPSPDLSKLGKHYLMLSKSRLTSLVVITSMAGYAMAPSSFELSTFLLCAAGTGLCSAAANSINQYHEVPFDAQMSRTKNRVLVKGLLTPTHAIGFAIGAASTGLCMLYYGCNGLTASLGLANLILYTSIYTPMKRFSILNTWVGSIVGAIPPVMGWVGCSGTIDTGAWILAGLLYAWQFPHFNALSWNLRADYSRAGYRMMCVTDPALCRRVALRYTFLIGALSLAAPYLEVTNVWFALETLPLNGYFCYLAWQFYRHSDSGTSRKLFRFSLIHLPLLMILFLLNKKRWIFSEQAEAAAAAAALTTADVTPALSGANETAALDLSYSNSRTDELEKKAIDALQSLLRE